MHGIRIPDMNNKTRVKLWTEGEIKLVLAQAENKRTPEEIAKKLNRSVLEVRSRLKSIAANMYLIDKMPYEKIHELTGVEKNTFILTPSKVKHEASEDAVLDVSIYDFPEDKPTVIVSPEITVSLESPFSVKSICEQLSTPIISSFSILAKIIS